MVYYLPTAFCSLLIGPWWTSLCTKLYRGVRVAACPCSTPRARTPLTLSLVFGHVRLTVHIAPRAVTGKSGKLCCRQHTHTCTLVFVITLCVFVCMCIKLIQSHIVYNAPFVFLFDFWSQLGYCFEKRVASNTVKPRITWIIRFRILHVTRNTR